MWLKKTIQSPKIGKSYKFKLSEENKNVIESRGGKAINFIMALHALEHSKKITKISWKEAKSYIFMEDGLLKHNQPYHKGQRKHGKGYPYVITFQDVLDEDWMVYHG